MSLRTHPLTIALRTVARKLGVTRTLSPLLQTRGYEAKFDRELLAAISEGDIVWDVGANVGHYTRKFAQAVGPSGRVFAFEPVPTIAVQLQQRVSEFDNVTVNRVALGAYSGVARMEAGADSLGATSRILDNDGRGDIQIEICTGDEAARSTPSNHPNVIKIDTEGFELDVLRGMPNIMRDARVRAIFIEVHFGLLAKRGISHAPAEIEKTLANHGFCARWIDASHIAGTRG